MLTTAFPTRAKSAAETDDPVPAEQAAAWTQEGVASYYGAAHQGRRTASGATFDMNALTAAHQSLAFGTRVRVTVRDTGQEVVVVVTDRLYSGRRVIDLSFEAARQLGMLRRGVAAVSLSPE